MIKNILYERYTLSVKKSKLKKFSGSNITIFCHDRSLHRLSLCYIRGAEISLGHFVMVRRSI